MATDLTHGPVAANLRRQALPMAAGLVAIISFDIVDLFFVSRLGDAPLAAISFTFPVIWFLTSIVIGFEAGAASCVSRAIGRRDNRSARRLTTDTALLAGLVVVVLAALGRATIEPLFRLLGATDELLPLIDAYIGIWYLAAPASAITWISLASMRARGNSLLEGKIIALAALLNAVLDPIFIFGLFGMPRLEIAGAAVATLTANVVVMTGALTYLHRTQRIYATPFTAISNVLDSWRVMLHIGIPAMMTNAIVPVANGIAIAMIAGYGVDAVAGFGVAVRIEPLALIAFYALSGIASPFMGQNFAAGLFARLEEARRVIARFCVVYGLLMAAVLAALAIPLAELFSETVAIRDMATSYLWIMALSYGGYGMVMSMCSGFNGVGYPLPGLLISASRALLVFYPLAMLGQALLGVQGIFVASATANISLGVISFLWFGRHIRKHPSGGTPVLG